MNTKKSDVRLRKAGSKNHTDDVKVHVLTRYDINRILSAAEQIEMNAVDLDNLCRSRYHVEMLHIRSDQVSSLVHHLEYLKLQREIEEDAKAEAERRRLEQIEIRRLEDEENERLRIRSLRLDKKNHINRAKKAKKYSRMNKYHV